MQILLLSSCSKEPLCPAFASSHHRFMENFTPFSKGFISSHGTGIGNDPFRMRGNIHGSVEALSPFSSGKRYSTKGGRNGDSFIKGNSNRKGDNNHQDSFSAKIKKRGPPKEKHEEGLWPKSMRLN